MRVTYVVTGKCRQPICQHTTEHHIPQNLYPQMSNTLHLSYLTTQ